MNIAKIIQKYYKMIIHKSAKITDEITKLKEDLMPKKNNRCQRKSYNRSITSNSRKSSRSTKSRSSRSFLSKEIIKNINKEKGEFFEHNIRKTLEDEYKWQKVKIERKFYYRKITFGDDYQILTPFRNIRIQVKNELFIFKLNEKGDCEIEDDNYIYPVPYDKDYTIRNITILKRNQIEIDGIYKLKNLKFPIFNPDEVSMIYNSFEDCEDIDENIAKDNISNESNIDSRDGDDDSNNNSEEESEYNNDKECGKNNKNNIDYEKSKDDNYNILSEYNYAVIEIKLSKHKTKDLIFQIKRDKEIMEKLIKGKILYIGFINSEDIDIDITKEVKGLNFILFGIRNSKFCGRDMAQYLDWNSIEKIQSLEERLDRVEERLDEVEERLDGVEKRLDGVEKRLDGVEKRLDGVEKGLGIIEKKIDRLTSLLGKKRGRGGKKFFLNKKKGRNFKTNSQKPNQKNQKRKKYS